MRGVLVGGCWGLGVRIEVCEQFGAPGVSSPDALAVVWFCYLTECLPTRHAIYQHEQPNKGISPVLEPI